MRGLINPSFDSALSVVGMDHDIDEPAWPRLHLGHRLALPRREPVRAAELQASGHKTDRLDCERLAQRADIDCDRAALQPGKRLRGVRCGGTARGAIDEYVHAELLCMPLHPSRDRSIAEREDLDTVRRQRFQLCKHVTIAAKAENARRSHGKGE